MATEVAQDLPIPELEDDLFDEKENAVPKAKTKRLFKRAELPDEVEIEPHEDHDELPGSDEIAVYEDTLAILEDEDDILDDELDDLPNGTPQMESMPQQPATELPEAESTEAPASLKPVTKRRRPRVKLTAELLLRPEGLPQLINEWPQRLKFKGEGHEAEDLRMLLQQYRSWAHTLQPAMEFPTFIEKAERICNSKVIKSWLFNRSSKQAEDSDDSDNDPADPPDVDGDYVPPEPNTAENTSRESKSVDAPNERNSTENKRRRALERLAAKRSSFGFSISDTSDSDGDDGGIAAATPPQSENAATVAMDTSQERDLTQVDIDDVLELELDGARAEVKKPRRLSKRSHFKPVTQKLHDNSVVDATVVVVPMMQDDVEELVNEALSRAPEREAGETQMASMDSDDDEVDEAELDVPLTALIDN